MGLDCNVSDDVLRLEFGCRSCASWMRQRVLEYAFKVARMDAARLPAVVARCAWPLAQHARRPELHAAVVARHEGAVGIQVAPHAACADTTYAAYKVQVSRAVRVAAE